MAITQVPSATPSGLLTYNDTALTGTKSAVKASSGTLYSITVDNTANVAASFLKLYDSASGDVTVGTTAPDWIIKIPASTKRSFPIPEGLAFATALTAACVTAGGTAGTTNPSSSVVVAITYA